MANKLTSTLRRLHIAYHGCDCGSHPKTCRDCNRPFRRWHVHVMQGAAWFVSCIRCAEASGAC